MSVSIAMCTFNGAAYLQEQLQSIAEQTLLPEEVVICDDGSTDETVSIIRSFSATAPFSVRLYQNEQTLKSTLNFEKALLLCQGDIIFLCDQDDIWLQGKIAAMVTWFKQHEDKEVVFTDGFVVGDNKEILDTLWNRIRFSASEQKLWKEGKGFKQLMQYQNRATGATMAVRRSFLPSVLPFEKLHFWLHDGIILTKAVLQHKAGFINEKLIYYRQHGQQQLGVNMPVERPINSFKGKIKNKKGINKDGLLQKNYEDICVIQVWVTDAKNKKIVADKIRHFERRIAANKEQLWLRPFIVLPEWIKGRYKKFSSGTQVPPWILVVKDLFGK